MSDKWEALEDRMEALGIYDDALLEKFILGSGSGGQKINKTASCVYLKHLPSGTEVKCQSDRSRDTNRYLARVELCDKLEAAEQARRSARKQARAKIRRQKRRRSPAQKARMLDEKSKHSQKKQQRRKPNMDD